MRPTYRDLREMQQAAARYHYDHTHPTEAEIETAQAMYSQASTTDDFLAAGNYGVFKGVWYFNGKDYIAPPKREWSDVG